MIPVSGRWQVPGHGGFYTINMGLPWNFSVTAIMVQRENGKKHEVGWRCLFGAAADFAPGWNRGLR